MMIHPDTLKKGDAISIVATGKKLDAGVIATAIEVIEGWGLKVLLGKNLFSTEHNYLSGSDAERLSDLQDALDNPEVKAIICARGGYGTTRILDQLTFDKFVKSPKWICGFSDVTSLQLQVIKLGVKSIHGTMPVLFPKRESILSVECLRNILFGGSVRFEAIMHLKNRSGISNGVLIGGNLSMIVDSLGTSSEIETKGRILIIEEIDEYLYRVDRMMVQLKRAGKLHELAGFVIGHMTEMKDTELPFGESIEGIIYQHVQEYNYPVGFGFPTGHENPNLPWIQGSIGTLSVTDTGAMLTF
jgi:muramoyltetrapeptide carboxypeptidase